MFECHACFRRYVRALLSTASPEPSTTSIRVAQGTRRAFQSTYAAPRDSESAATQDFANVSQTPRRVLTPPPPSLVRRTLAPDAPNWDKAPRYSKQKAAAKQALTKPRRPAYTPREATSKRLTPGNISTELKYLRDPLKLADHIRYVLEQGDDEKALALVRMSSASLANTVSWNHLIDWQMRNGKTKAAMDTYNEMKKRGQKPDSHTYILILRGYADNAERNPNTFHTLGKALSVYHSMSAPNSKVAPSIMHTNAMLKVCARANDMDSIWDIASKLPERGPHAANSWTFTTILNGMRMNALISAPNGEASDAVARRREETIIQARKLWGPIKARWRQGDLMLDEELVCAMGRLLLVGVRPRDWDDVLSLIQQAMNIPRMIPRLGSAGREEANVPRIRAPDTPRDMKNDASEIVDEYDDPRPGSEFDAFDPETPRTVGGSGSASTSIQNNQYPYPRRGSGNGDRGPAGYAQPGRNTLSLILEACLKLASKQPALDYWNLLTDPNAHAILPDSDNLHMLLRVLRHSRSAAESAALLCDDFPRLRVPQLAKSFRIAMSTCVRDSKNPAALDEHAFRILDAMRHALPDPDTTTLVMFVGLAREANEIPRLSRALDRLDAPVAALKSMVSFREDLTHDQKEACFAVFRAVIGCYDKVLRMDSKSQAEGGGGGGGGSGGSGGSGSSGGNKLTPRTRSLYIERSKSLAAFVARRADAERRQRVGKEAERRQREAEREEGKEGVVGAA